MLKIKLGEDITVSLNVDSKTQIGIPAWSSTAYNYTSLEKEIYHSRSIYGHTMMGHCTASDLWFAVKEKFSWLNPIIVEGADLVESAAELKQGVIP